MAATEHTDDDAQRWTVRTFGWYLLLTALSFVVLFPIYMTIVRALSTPVAYANAGNPPYPVDVQWDIFGRALDQGGLSAAAWQSVVMTVIITVAQLITATLAAYAFVFLRFPFKRFLFAVFLATLMLPIEVTLVANVQYIRQLGWIDTMPGLTTPFLATGFGTFLIRQGFLGVPPEIRDATQLDGYGHLSFLTRFAVPLTRPVIASFTVISFLSAWNQYLWPRAIIQTESRQTLQIAIATLTNANPQQANIGVAGALLAALPILILLILFQRQIVRGLTAGAVKG